MSRFTAETKAKADVFTGFLSSLDIEWRYQSTYFDDEVCVHWYGNNERALIMSPIQFINWAAYWFTPTKQDLYARRQESECTCDPTCGSGCEACCEDEANILIPD